jgi:4-alpha-glucanotransferase
MDNLDRLFYWRGIANDYFNYRGERVVVSLENRLGLLQAMGVNTESQEVIDKQAYALDIAPWQNWLAPFQVAEEGDATQFEVNLPPEYIAQEFCYRIYLENGALRQSSQMDGNWGLRIQTRTLFQACRCRR